MSTKREQLLEIQRNLDNAMHIAIKNRRDDHTMSGPYEFESMCAACRIREAQTVRMIEWRRHRTMWTKEA